MKEVTLASYEYDQGFALKNIPAFQCPRCKEIFFTEDQADMMERITENCDPRDAVREMVPEGRSTTG